MCCVSCVLCLPRELPVLCVSLGIVVCCVLMCVLCVVVCVLCCVVCCCVCFVVVCRFVPLCVVGCAL